MLDPLISLFIFVGKHYTHRQKSFTDTSRSPNRTPFSPQGVTTGVLSVRTLSTLEVRFTTSTCPNAIVWTTTSYHPLYKGVSCLTPTDLSLVTPFQGPSLRSYKRDRLSCLLRLFVWPRVRFRNTCVYLSSRPSLVSSVPPSVPHRLPLDQHKSTLFTERDKRSVVTGG